MSTRNALAALALILGLPLLGYLWPLPVPESPSDSEDRWFWPEPVAISQHGELPANLASYWPGEKPTGSSVADSQAADGKPQGMRHDWMLIGIIAQGANLSALVQDPQRNILTLSPGDRLDELRSVSELHATSLLWRDTDGKTGELPLYPQPAAE